MRLAGIAFIAIWLLACRGSGDGARNVGDDRSTKSRTLEAGAGFLQSRSALAGFRRYIDGFHFENGNPNRQLEVHHFCSKVNEEVTQCVLFDGDSETAHLTGIEYIVSRRMFDSFAPEERKLWHSHVYEVKSGELITPGLTDAAERDFMRQFVNTYGKTWHTWNSQRGEQLPTGAPSLMMAFTKDGQLKPELLQFRDERLQVSSADKRKQRDSIPDPGIAENADSWERGPALQVQISAQKTARKTPTNGSKPSAGVTRSKAR